MKKAAGVAIVLAAVLTASAAFADRAAQPLEVDAAESSAENTEESARDGAFVFDSSVPLPSGLKIAVVSKNTQGEFWDLLRKGMEAAVSDVNTAYGYEKDDQLTMTFEGPDDEKEVEEQINTLDAVIAENPDLLCLAAGDMDSCQAQLEAARENGIPVVAFDSNVSETELISAFRGTDNEKVGEMAAGYLAEALEGSGKIAVFSPQEKTQSAQERIGSFLNALPDGIEVAEVVYADQVEDMEAAIEAVLVLHPDLNGVFCSNADITDMYLSIEKSGENPPVLVGVDATSRQVEAVRNGEELGIVSQNPYEMGYQTILTALSCLTPEGEEPDIEKNVLLEPVWLDQSNLDDEKYAEYIYSK